MKFLSDSTPWNGRAQKYNKVNKTKQNELKSNAKRKVYEFAYCVCILIRIMAIDYINSRHTVCTILDLFISFAIAFHCCVCVSGAFCRCAKFALHFVSKLYFILNLQGANLVRDPCVACKMYTSIPCVCVCCQLCTFYCCKNATQVYVCWIVLLWLKSFDFVSLWYNFLVFSVCCSFALLICNSIFIALFIYLNCVFVNPIGHIANVDVLNNCAWWCLWLVSAPGFIYTCDWEPQWRKKWLFTIAASDYLIKKFDVLINSLHSAQQYTPNTPLFESGFIRPAVQSVHSALPARFEWNF